MKNWKWIPWFACLMLFLSVTASASDTVSVTLALPDGTPVEKTVSCPENSLLWYASYTASGQMLEAGRASVQDGKAAVTLTQNAETVKAFALDDNCKPLSAAEINLTTGGGETNYSAYYTENLVRMDELTVGGVHFKEQTLDGMRQIYYDSTHVESGHSYEDDYFTEYCRFEYSNGQIEGTAEDGHIVQFSHSLWQDAEKSENHLPPTEIRGIELGQNMADVLRTLGLTEYAVNEFMSHAGSDTPIIILSIKSGRITRISYIEFVSKQPDFLQVMFGYRDAKYELSFVGSNGIADDMFYYDYRRDEERQETDYSAYYTDNLVRMDEMTVGGVFFNEQTLDDVSKIYSGTSSDYFDSRTSSRTFHYSNGDVYANAIDGYLYGFSYQLWNETGYTGYLPPLELRGINVGQNMGDVLKTLGLTDYAVSEILSYEGSDAALISLFIESGRITQIIKSPSDLPGYLYVAFCYSDFNGHFYVSGFNGVVNNISYEDYNPFTVYE